MKKLNLLIMVCFAVTVLFSNVVSAESIKCSDQDMKTTNILIAKQKTKVFVTDKGSKESSSRMVSYSSSISGGGDGGGSGLTTKPANYPTRKGVILVTHDSFKGLPLGHAAIVYSETQVIESVSDGVVIGKNDWWKTKYSSEAGSVNNTTTSQDSVCADWCYSKLGKPYNYNYFDIGTRSKFYCSQLVYAAYKDNFNIDLNTSNYKTPFGNPVHPVELLSDNSKTYITYQVNW